MKTLKEILQERKRESAPKVSADTTPKAEVEQAPAYVLSTFPQSDFQALFDGIEDF